ncbi:MAG TPA: hypothetical protein VFD43_11770 [Planctomycetota bacterium]|nr:hypothetical protein [Planctomycetota bacterium]
MASLRMAVAASALSALCGGCALVSPLAELPELDANPLIRVEHTAEGATEIELLGPLVDLRWGPEGFSHAFRPFYQHKANYGDWSTDYLAPLGRSFGNFSGTKFRLWPLIWAGEIEDTGEGDHWAGIFFPIILAGDGPQEDDGYFAIFPLIGRTRGVFGIEQFDFFIWPLFMRTRMHVTEQSNSYTVLLLGGWTEGGPRDGSWRILPFYRHRLWRTPDGTLRTDQHSVLWPFFTWGLDHGDSRAPSQRYAFWPLVGYESSDTWYRCTVLWPFFRFNSDTQPKVEGEPEFLYDFPWPFFRRSRGDGETVSRAWPIYSHSTTPEVDSTCFLWPLGWWRKTDALVPQPQGDPVRAYRRSLYFIPFLYSSRQSFEGREEQDSELQVWPLWHDNRGATGRLDQGFFSLWPARDVWFMRPADELYSFIWTLWRRQSDGATTESRVLFDTTLWRNGPAGVRVSVPFLYSRRPEPEGVSRHEILWGLFGARTDEQGLSELTVLGFAPWAR